MSDLFVTRENKYNPINLQALESSHRRTVTFGSETISTGDLKYGTLSRKG